MMDWVRCVCGGGGGGGAEIKRDQERSREIKRDQERPRETERDRERRRETERDRERPKETERDGERWRETERDRERPRETERDGERWRETKRDRDRESDREFTPTSVHSLVLVFSALATPDPPRRNSTVSIELSDEEKQRLQRGEQLQMSSASSPGTSPEMVAARRRSIGAPVQGREVEGVPGISFPLRRGSSAGENSTLDKAHVTEQLRKLHEGKNSGTVYNNDMRGDGGDISKKRRASRNGSSNVVAQEKSSHAPMMRAASVQIGNQSGENSPIVHGTSGDVGLVILAARQRQRRGSFVSMLEQQKTASGKNARSASTAALDSRPRLRRYISSKSDEFYLTFENKVQEVCVLGRGGAGRGVREREEEKGNRGREGEKRKREREREIER